MLLLIRFTLFYYAYIYTSLSTDTFGTTKQHASEKIFTRNLEFKVAMQAVKREHQTGIF